MRNEKYIVVCLKYGYGKTILKKKTFNFIDKDYRPLTIGNAMKKALELRGSGEWDDVLIYKSKVVLEEVSF